ncbi:MAG: hypothetical protein WKF83_07635 [Nocardioidaceae bacterium]
MTNGDDAQRLAAEQRARVLIDRQLVAAGWVVQDKKDLNLFAAQGVAVRESIMAAGHGRADYLLYVDKAAVGVIEAKPGLETSVADVLNQHTVSPTEAKSQVQQRGAVFEAHHGARRCTALARFCVQFVQRAANLRVRGGFPRIRSSSGTRLDCCV